MKTPFYKPLWLRAAFCVALWTCTAAQAAAPIITNLTMVGAAPRFAVQSDLGITNQIQCCTNLSQTNWVALTNLLVAQSPYWFVDVAAPPDSQRFYQVVALPTNGLGFTWINQPMPNPQMMNGGTATAFGNGVFCVTGYGPYWTDTSPDGVHYTYGPTCMSSANWSGMAYGNGLFVVVGSAGAFSNYSRDGLNWLASPSPMLLNAEAVCFGNNRFVLIGPGGPTSYSDDGIHWSTGGTLGYPAYAITYGDGLFVVVGNFFAYPFGCVWTSTDGINWTPGTCPGKNWKTVTYGNGLFVACTGDNSGYVMTSPDGLNWTLRTCPPIYGVASCYGGGVFVVVGGQSGFSSIIASTDGVNWTQRVNDVSPEDYLFTVSYGNGIFLACRNTTGYYTSGP